MPGSVFGEFLTISTFGESHGAAVGVVVDGVPPGLALSAADIQRDLDRRRPGQSGVTSGRREPDRAEVLSGLFEGRTTGTPIAILIRNEEHRSSDYERFREAYRPGHADWTYQAKYGIRDWRGGGRSSGRETAARVAAGAVARAILAVRGVTVTGYTLEIAGIRAARIDLVGDRGEPRARARSGGGPAHGARHRGGEGRGRLGGRGRGGDRRRRARRPRRPRVRQAGGAARAARA